LRFAELVLRATAAVYSDSVRRLLVVAVLGALLAGCGGGEETASPPLDTPPAPDANRAPAPPIAGESLEGERVSLAGFRGRPVLINVWSSW
jgi:hypothetical protein